MSASSSRASSPRPRLAQVAQRAGVSASTVDRVLNERGSVSEALRARVITAARQLDLKRVLPSLRHGVLHIDAVMSHFGSAHHRRLERALMAQASALDARICLHRVYGEAHDEAALVRFIERPPHPRAALLAFVRDVPRMRAALRAVQAQGTPVVTVTSAVSQLRPHPHAGIDNVRAGRAAGYLLGRFLHRPGTVLLYVPSTEFAEHRDRSRGFCGIMHEQFAHLRVKGPLVHGDLPQAALASLDALLAQRDDIVAIYDTGSAAAGLSKALQRHGRHRHHPRPVWIAHEASREHVQLMARGTIAAVIDQDPEAQAAQALQHVLYLLDERDLPPPQVPTRFRLITPEGADAAQPLD